MKTLLWWLNYRPLQRALLGVAFAAALVSLGMQCELSKSDWAAWLGAIGTVGALCGTIYLARTETRRRQRAEHDLALITAASFSIRIPELEQALTELGRHVSDDIELGRAIDCNRCLAILKRVDAWTDSDLVALLPVGRGIAVKLGLANAEVASIMGRLREGDRGDPLIANPQLKHSFSRMLTSRIGIAKRHLMNTRNECLVLLLKAGIDDAFAVSQHAARERIGMD